MTNLARLETIRDAIHESFDSSIVDEFGDPIITEYLLFPPDRPQVPTVCVYWPVMKMSSVIDEFDVLVAVVFPGELELLKYEDAILQGTRDICPLTIQMDVLRTYSIEVIPPLDGHDGLIKAEMEYEYQRDSEEV